MSSRGNAERIDVGIDFGMILSEQRHPSLDAIHHLITGISQINDGLNKLKHLDNLYEEGQSLITKRLLKYF